jgi:hypothetical protein
MAKLSTGNCDTEVGLPAFSGVSRPERVCPTLVALGKRFFEGYGKGKLANHGPEPSNLIFCYLCFHAREPARLPIR